MSLNVVPQRAAPVTCSARPALRHDELADLASAAVQGNRGALRTFLLTVTPQLLRVARRVLGPGHPDLEDVTHEAAYAVVEGLRRFRGEGTVLHYACRVALLTAMNVRRRETAGKRAHERHRVDPDAIDSRGPSPEQSAHLSSLAPIVRELVAELPEPLAEVFALHTILGYTVLEIAQTSGVPLETVRSRLRLARHALRRKVLGHPALREALEDEA